MWPLLRAYSFHQPWAWLVSINVKRVENRGRPPVGMMNEWIALHASKTFDEKAAEYIRAQGLEIPEAAHVHGAVIGAFCVDSYVCDDDMFRVPRQCLEPDQVRWYFGPFGWMVRGRALKTPITARGYQVCWRLDQDTSDAIWEQGVI